MNRFRECPELFQLVCYHVSSIQDGSVFFPERLLPVARKALVSLALTCRAFSQPATEQLWSRIVYDKPAVLLIAELLPQDLVEYDELSYRLRRTITKGDIELLKRRTRYVRELTLCEVPLETEGTFQSSMGCIIYMQASIVPQDYPLFPRLQELVIRHSHPRLASYLHFILSPSVVDITIGDVDMTDRISRAIVTGIRRACPKVAKLDLRCESFPTGSTLPPTSQYIDSAIQGWEALRVITLQSPDFPTLKALSRLPGLEDARFMYMCPTPYIGPGPTCFQPNGGSGFPSLQILEMHTELSLRESCTPMIRLLGNSPVKELYINFGPHHDPHASQDLIGLLPKHINHASLERLDIAEFPDSDGKPWTPSSEEGVISSDDPYNLAALHPFYRLSRIRIVLEYLLPIGLDVLEPLGAQLPQLKLLELDSASGLPACHADDIKLKLHDLIAIGRAIPELESLAVLMDASGLTQPSTIPAQSFQHKKLEALSVARSPIHCAEDVVLFLSDIFPHLRKILIDPSMEIPFTEVGSNSYAEEPRYKKWRQVESMLQMASRVRAHERAWAFGVEH